LSAPRLPPDLRLAALGDVPEAGALVVTFEHAGERVSLILTRKEGVVHAFHNRCAHANSPLQRADGRVLVQEGRYLVCGAHGASYALESGACAGGPCNGRGLVRMPIIVREGAVFTAR
jgi:nitrite reductase/ring-hydroxylating ferredoxin subunit